MRTGGFAGYSNDWELRDADILFGALDQLLAGTLPYYRMQFRLTAEEGVFVPGGHVKVHLRIDVPTPLPHRGVFAVLDVALP